MTEITRPAAILVVVLACIAVTAGAVTAQSSGAFGPTTVITRPMLDDIGARTLREALVAYVPGMTFSQDQNEINVAMRGVYSSSQQKFLVLVDGHVLNFRSYATANPDYSIALDHIDRIEVSRGPLSAIHGDGALTAVVNLISMQGKALGAAVVTASAGTFGQSRVSGRFGAETTGGADLLAWGALYRSEGQTVDVPAGLNLSRVAAPGRAYLDRFMGPSSHDVGLTLTEGRFTLFAAHRYGKYAQPFSDGGPTGETYRYEDYLTPDVGGPGLGIGATNLHASVRQPLTPQVDLRLDGYVDRRELAAHLVSDPSTRAHQLVQWKEWGTGGTVQAEGTYGDGTNDGRWTVGAQVDRMRVDDSVLLAGTGATWATVGPRGGLLELGSEQTYSGFGRVSHPLAEAWRASAALRYDRKDRHEGDDITRVSPALSLVYAPGPEWHLAASYTEGFVDAPYWYRYNTLASYRGGRRLEPERLRSFQVTSTRRLSDSDTGRVNLFVNRLDDGVWRNNAAGPADPIYQNGGELRTWGIEPEFSHVSAATRVTASLTYQRVARAANVDVVGSRVTNVPALAAGVTGAINPWSGQGRDFWFDATARFIGSQASPVAVTLGDVATSDPGREVDAAMVVNIGARYGWARRFHVEGRVFNLFDADYEQGGSVVHPYPQPGRSAIATLQASF